jgi:SM-20-related protein
VWADANELENAMTTSDPASDFGLFLRRQFIDPETCARIIAEIRSAPTTQAPVYIEGSPDLVHENVRKTTSLHPSEETITWVYERLFEQTPSLIDHFKLDLTDCEQPQFLVYRAGDFFVRHQDGNSEQLEFDHLRVRKISIVVFLNDAADTSAGSKHDAEAGTFRGGALLFCREGDAQHEPVTFPLWGETGLLVAFASETLHEVTPVTDGERFTIINFFK